MASKKNRAPIPNPFSIDYSPTDRAICKGCDGRLAEGSLRLLKKVWSPWHDGFDLYKYHLRCGTKFVKNLQEVTGWQALRWEDVVKVAEKFGEEIQDSHPVVQTYKRRSSHVWQLTDLLQEVPKKQLLAILDANEIFYNEKKVSALDAAQWIADGIFFGRLPSCPICETRALVQEGCTLRCRGYMPASSTRCCFRYVLHDLLSPSSQQPANASSGVDANAVTRTELFILPPEAQRMPLFRQWKAPADFPEAFQLGNPLHALQQQKRKMTFDSEAEEEASVPKKRELAGLIFASIGTTIPPKQQLLKLIGTHGGVFEEALSPRTDFLLVHDEEFAAARHSQRYQDALLTGIPIMRCSFVTSLISRKNVQPALPLAEAKKKIKTEGFHAVLSSLPKGLLLRQRKYAAYYLVEGQLSRPLQRVAAAVEQQQTAAAAALSKATVKRPPIRPGSPLLTVDPLFTLKGQCSIYVDAYGNAYNAATQYTDISTGVNKYYHLQLIKKEKTFFLFIKWGRLGADDKTTNDYRQTPFGSQLQRAVAAFEAKFYGLTGVQFCDRMEAKQQPGRYAIIELDGYLHDDDVSTKTAAAAAAEGRGGGAAVAAAAVNGAAAAGGRERQEQEQQEQQQQRRRVKREGEEGAAAAAEETKKRQKRKTKEEGKKEKVAMTRAAAATAKSSTGEAANHTKKEKEEEEERKKKQKTQNDHLSTNVKAETKSNLHPEVQQLIKLIFDTEMTKKALREQHLNLQRMPIHSISRRQLSDGYAVLQEIQRLLQETGEQRATDKFKIKIADATNRFYNKIPHVFEHSAVPPVIDTLAKLRAKVEMMEQLLDVCVAHSLIKGALKESRELHPLDAQYQQLHCVIEPVEKKSREWQLIETMLIQTRPPTHNTWSLQLQHLFRCCRCTEKEQFNRAIDNRRLLWHGSRLTNWPSVIAHGLKIAPPEAPSSGYMFGKGLYFADMASKSSQYCFATSKNPQGLMVLAEVALGKPLYKLEAASHADVECMEKGCNSVWSLGKSCVDPKGDVFIDSAVDGEKVIAKTGTCVSNRAAVEEVKKELGTDTDATLLYNEYVVYSTSQVLLRYLVQVKFEFATFDLDV